MKLIIGTFFIVAFAVLSCHSTSFIKCLNGEPPLELRVTNCTKLPCLFHRGSDLVAEWDFKVANEIESLKPKLLIGRSQDRIMNDYPFSQKDACSSLIKRNCPLKAGDIATYQLKMPILKNYPSIPVAIEYSFLDDKNNLILCFKVHGQIVN